MGLRKHATGIAVLVGAVLLAASVTPGFRTQGLMDEIRPGPGVTRVEWLSSYHAGLAGGPGDTPVFVLEAAADGGTTLVLGGTHADETAGYLAAVLLVERALPRAGRVIVIPRANASGFTHTMPLEGHPPRISIPTGVGSTRTFAVGSRATNPTHQWPDPQVYVLPESGQRLSGIDTRNLNRAYPGRRNGTLTEQIAFAITSLIVDEHVAIAFDLHEAAPEYPVVNTIVAHERAADLAALVAMNLDESGIRIGLEISPPQLHGLSHREWGDHSDVLAILLETTNPAQGRLRGHTDETQILSGRDRFYAAAAAAGRLKVSFDEYGWPLELRVARHVAAVNLFLESYSELEPQHKILVDGLPEYKQLATNGTGRYLN